MTYTASLHVRRVFGKTGPTKGYGIFRARAGQAQRCLYFIRASRARAVIDLFSRSAIKYDFAMVWNV